MDKKYYIKIAEELNVSTTQVINTAALLESGATVPFIARYRKELTGSLDEVAMTDIRDRLKQLQDLDKRRDAILKSIEEQGKLTDQLKAQILEALTLPELEDLYLPYKPKKRTRATIAKEKGLEPLAKIIMAKREKDPYRKAALYINSEKGVANEEEALAGARDIIAEWISEDQVCPDEDPKIVCPGRYPFITCRQRQGTRWDKLPELLRLAGTCHESPIASLPGHDEEERLKDSCGLAFNLRRKKPSACSRSNSLEIARMVVLIRSGKLFMMAMPGCFNHPWKMK